MTTTTMKLCGAKNTAEFLWESSCWALSHECDPVRHNCAIFPLSFHSRDCSHEEDDTVTFVSTFAAVWWSFEFSLKLDLFMMRSRDVEWASYDDDDNRIHETFHIYSISRPRRFSSTTVDPSEAGYFDIFLHSNGRHSATQQECFWMKFFSFGWWS